mmetsp:Transcript_114158/g.198436  ORF Transcript_114158/g.198436 Transcript_114158/m.198436 type:complete len:214 (+) Transcript_114158:1377-2018(+)
MAFLLVVLPITIIGVPVGVSVASFAILLVKQPLPIVPAAICIYHAAHTRPLVVLPLPDINEAFLRPPICTGSFPLVVRILANIHITVDEDGLAQTGFVALGIPSSFIASQLTNGSHGVDVDTFLLPEAFQDDCIQFWFWFFFLLLLLFRFSFCSTCGRLLCSFSFSVRLVLAFLHPLVINAHRRLVPEREGISFAFLDKPLHQDEPLFLRSPH